MNNIKKFKLHRADGTSEIITGITIIDALSKSSDGQGSVRVFSWYEEVAEEIEMATDMTEKVLGGPPITGLWKAMIIISKIDRVDSIEIKKEWKLKSYNFLVFFDDYTKIWNYVISYKELELAKYDVAEVILKKFREDVPYEEN